jgi:hypothetical protein
MRKPGKKADQTIAARQLTAGRHNVTESFTVKHECDRVLTGVIDTAMDYSPGPTVGPITRSSEQL